MHADILIMLRKLEEPFEKILSANNFGDVGNTVAEMIYKVEFSEPAFTDILEKAAHAKRVNEELLQVVVAYVKHVLEDNYITAEEAENIKLLKLLFRVREGDFYRYKYAEVEMILQRQFEHMYQNNQIDTKEALQKVELQQLFDLSYDEFLHISYTAVKAALERGADPVDLDTYMRLAQ